MADSTCTIDEDGTKIYKNTQGQFHREDGPAVEYANGYKAYYLSGKRHRVNGPAIEYVNGTKVWFYQGKEIQCTTQEEFDKLIKLKVFW